MLCYVNFVITDENTVQQNVLCRFLEILIFLWVDFMPCIQVHIEYKYTVAVVFDGI